jgi:hypothetical protein
MWTLAYGQHRDGSLTHAFEAMHEAAMAAFAKSWHGNRRVLTSAKALVRGTTS